MEYKIFKYLREHFKIPYIVRFFISIFIFPFAFLFIVLPVFPLSLVVWLFLLAVCLILLVPWEKLRHVVKIRKSTFYLFKNITNKHIIKHKFYDLITHFKSILRERKIRKQTKKELKF